MAYDTNIASNAGFGLRDRLSALIADFRAQAARRKVYRDTLSELNALSIRELNDLGMDHTMLKRIAYQAAYES